MEGGGGGEGCWKRPTGDDVESKHGAEHRVKPSSNDNAEKRRVQDARWHRRQSASHQRAPFLRGDVKGGRRAAMGRSAGAPTPPRASAPVVPSAGLPLPALRNGRRNARPGGRPHALFQRAPLAKKESEPRSRRSSLPSSLFAAACAAVCCAAVCCAARGAGVSGSCCQRAFGRCRAAAAQCELFGSQSLLCVLGCFSSLGCSLFSTSL